jgi:hypothetical protein
MAAVMFGILMALVIICVKDRSQTIGEADAGF